MINELYSKLSSKGMLGYCGISAMDANTIDEAVNGVAGYANVNAISKIVQINAHSYSGTKRSELQALAFTHGKRLWQSESGPLGISSSGLDNNLTIAARIIQDMNQMKPVAWIDWQIMDGGDLWGLISYNSTTKVYSRNKNYYVRMQFSRFIKPGYTIISTDNSNVLAALNPAKTEVVVVALNTSSTATGYTLNLGNFDAIGISAFEYRTSSTENCIQVNEMNISGKSITFSANAKSLTTLIIPVGISATGLQNPGFEMGGGAQTPLHWMTTSASAANADYYEAGGYSGTYRLAHYSTSSYEVYTYQNVTGLSNGSHAVSAWVKSSGGQTQSYMIVKGYGGTDKKINIPVTSSWTKITIADIMITNGQCEIGFYSLSPAGKWINVDDVSLDNTTFYTLNVSSGTGDGKYIAGTSVYIAADVAPAGKLFDKWTGATSGFANINSSTTTFTMPETDLSLTATYKDILYSLTVKSGIGGGSYPLGTIVNITANAPAPGKVFDKWLGATSAVADVYSASTTLTMPSAITSIIATYKDATDMDDIRDRVSFYPNPTSDYINLKGCNNYQNLQIYSLEGTLHKAISISSANDITIDVSFLEEGLYIIKLTDNKCQDDQLMFVKY